MEGPVAIDVEPKVALQEEAKRAVKDESNSSTTDHVIYGLQIIRVVGVIIVFISGALSIVTTQFAFKLLFNRQFNIIHGILSLTKKHFVVLVTSIINTICPSKIRITADLKSMRKGSFKIINNNLHSVLSPSSVVIANHQIYTDWVFLWWVAYTAQLGDSVYIMLKDSLKKIPFLGYGMKNYKFIFLSRKWEKDAKIMEESLQRLNSLNVVGSAGDFDSREGKKVQHSAKDLMKWPYCLILFPEGTNMSPSRREVSDKYCNKLGRDKLRNVLLPRVTGLRHTLRQLRNSCKVVYDVTIGYSNVSQDQYGETIYTLKSVFIKGKSPKITDMYFRAINLDEIPLGNVDETPEEEEESIKEFQKWLFRLWDSKDELMDTYYKHGSFTPDIETDEKVLQDHEVVVADLKLRSSFEFLQIYAVPAILLLFARIFYQLITRFTSD